MEINRLLADELAYELLIRGAATDGTVDEKRQRLRTFMRLERSGDLPATSAILVDPESEIEACHCKLLELGGALRSFDFTNAANERSRIHARLMHVRGRLDRIVDRNFAQAKAQLMTRCAEIRESLNDLSDNPRVNINFATPPPVDRSNQENLLIDVEDIRHLEPHVSILDMPNEPTLVNEMQSNSQVLAHLTCPTPQPLIPLPPSQQHTMLEQVVRRNYHPDPPARVTFDTAGCAADSMPRHSSLTNAHRMQLSPPSGTSHAVERQHNDSRMFDNSLSRHMNPGMQPLTSLNAGFVDLSKSFGILSKWNLKFTGQGSVANFIERAEELADACGLSHVHLFHCAIVFFSDMALSWFRAVRDSLHSWEELKAKLRATYLSPEYEEDIWNDIRGRTQGPCEKTAIFIAQMRNLFKKLAQRPSEEVQLRIIRRNLLPDLQTQLALQSFGSVGELEAAAQALENVRLRVQRMRPPPSNPGMVTEPECMYQRPRGAQLHVTTAMEQGVSVTHLDPTPSSDSVSRVVCWNCREPGHLRRKCSRPFQQHCFRCGRQNVTIRSCPRCSTSGNGPANH